MAYKVKAPWILKDVLYRRLIWKMPAEEVPSVYLTFDDGPHPTATPFVLAQLKKYQAKATFFCIGANVKEHPELFKSIKDQGHTTGNHTYNHLNGWNTGKSKYILNIRSASEHIVSSLFRPPYGRITRGQINALTRLTQPMRIYMWDVLSGDFDTGITPEKCLENVLKYIEPGSIVVFHDSEKAWDRMSYALPRVLQHCAENKWAFKALPQD